MERVEKWEPLAGLDEPFGSLSYTYEHPSLQVLLLGAKRLSLHFTGVVAVRFELECPGYDPLPRPLPMLQDAATFPLLQLHGSPWLQDFQHIYPGVAHFALISSDHLLQLIAQPQPKAAWVPA